MNVCIFGAGGRTGVEVAHYARKKGYGVTAFVYSDSSKEFLPHDIKIVQGNVLNYEDVQKAVAHAGAVISVVGHVKDSDPYMQTKGMQNIVKAMKAHNVTRILSLTGTGVRTDGDKPSFLDRILNIAIRFIDPARIKDGIEHVKVIQNSKLDWTVVRVLKLRESSQESTSYKLTEGGPAEFPTSRKKVAHVLVDLIDDTEYIGKMPVISKMCKI